MKNYINLSFIFIFSFFFTEAHAENFDSASYVPNYMGQAEDGFLNFQFPDKTVGDKDISAPQNLLRNANARGECLYADGQYIVIVSVIDKFSEKDKRGEGMNRRLGSGHLRTSFYDSRTLKPIFHLPFGADQVEFNKKLGLFALSHDSLTTDKIYREVYIVVLNPVTQKGAAMSLYTERISGDEMSWNGNELELRIAGSPIRGVKEAFRFKQLFLGQPIIVRSIEMDPEEYNDKHLEEKEEQAIQKRKRFDEIWKSSDSLGGHEIHIGKGMSPGCIAFTDGKDVLNHLNFNDLKYQAIEMQGKTFSDFGSWKQRGMWIITDEKEDVSRFTVRDEAEIHFSYECPWGLCVSSTGAEAWGSGCVFDITPEGLHNKFEVPQGKNMIGADFENREILVQNEMNLEGKDDFDVWVERMTPASFDMDTGKMKSKKCAWYEVGEPSNSSVFNEGGGLGIAPKGWKVSAQHNDFRRMDGFQSSISICMTSGKNVRYEEGEPGEVIPRCGKAKETSIYVTADKSVSLYAFPSDEKSMMLVYNGMKGGQAIAFDIKTLKSYEIANWSNGDPLWLPGKQWLFVPRSGYYDVLRIDKQRDENPVFSFYYSKRGYAIVLPNGLYTGSPGCESLIQYKNETEGVERRAKWRNRPGEVLEALGGNSESIQLLKEETKRWHQKINFDPSTPEPSVSDMPIAQVPKLPDLFSSDPVINLPVSFTGTTSAIDRCSLKINGEETIFSFKTSIQPGQTDVAECPLDLVNGVNWIEIRAITQQGIMGDAVRFRVIGRDISR